MNGYDKNNKPDISLMFFDYYDRRAAIEKYGTYKLGYMKKDLDNDGIDELIFGEIPSKNGNKVIYDIFTIQDGECVHVATGWERERFYLCTDGTIGNEGSGGAAYSSWTYYKYSNAKLDFIESVYTNDKVPGQRYYYATDEKKQTEEPISEETAKEIIENYTYEELDLTPFVE